MIEALSDPQLVAGWLAVLMTLSSAALAAYKLVRRVEHRFETLTALDARITKEFGGNSGGIRQVVDAVAKDVTAIMIDTSDLRGRFEQHIAEHRR